MMMNGSGFGLLDDEAGGIPLAARMRPSNINEVAGQARALKPGSPLRRMIDSGQALSVILWGPPGTGKTTIALLLSRESSREFVALSAAEVGVKEVREEVEKARKRRVVDAKQTVLFVDEIHRFSKSQQDSLLGAVENGWVSLVAATTENPSFSIINPLLSRSTLVKLEALSEDDLKKLIKRALTSPLGLSDQFTLTDQALDYLARLGGGDARKTLTLLEAAASSAGSLGVTEVTLDILETAIDTALPRYDKNGLGHYNTISAFIKAIRGSDVDASLLYLARMLAAGEDPRFIARRLIISASEDIGTADSASLGVAVNAAQAVALLGMPEASYPLAHATVHLAMAPKSDAVSRAYGQASAALGVDHGEVPPHLVNVGHKAHPRYRNPHLDPTGVVKQSYLPEEHAKEKFYHPKEVGFEAKFKERLDWLRKVLGR